MLSKIALNDIIVKKVRVVKIMVMRPIICPDCKSENIGKSGYTASGKQRYICKNVECKRATFVLEYKANQQYIIFYIAKVGVL